MGELGTGQTTLYDDPLFYDLLFSNHLFDTAYYADQIANLSGDILEIGCGSGRLTIHLAGLGHRITGLDRSASMLERLRAQASMQCLSVPTIHADFMEETPSRYDVVLAPFNFLAHFDRTVIPLALRRLRSWVRDQGHLILDVPTPQHAAQFLGGKMTASVSGRENTGVDVVHDAAFDRPSGRLDLTWKYIVHDAGETLVQRQHALSLWCHPGKDVLSWIESAGFGIVSVDGGYAREPFSTLSERLVVVARVG